MIKPTASQQTAINEKRYQHFVRFTLDPLTTLTIGEDEIWEGGFKVDQAVSGRSAFELGACVVNQLKVGIYNPNGTYQNTDFLGKPVYAYIELYDTDNTTVIGTISKGHYIVTEADTNGQIVKLTCLDAMSTLDRPYTDVNTVYPATLYNIVNDIATLAGLTLSLDGVNWLPTGITSAYTVTVRPTDVNCRDVLSAVCQATGNYATIDRLGQLLITRYDTAFIAETGSDYSGYDYNEVDPSNLFSLTRDEAQVTLTGISVEVGEDAYTAGTDDYMIHIVDNPVINAGSEQTFATALDTLVNGWNFRPFEADTRSNMCMEAGDNVVITDTLGNVYKSIVTHVEYEAGNKQNAECNADPASVQSSKRYSEAAKAASQTVKVYDSTVNNYIDLVSKGLGMYRSLITDPDDPTQQIYAFHNEETIGDSTFCMFENSNGIQVGRRDTTSDPWVYTSADVEDAVVLAQTLVANTAIINQLFSEDITVTGKLHSDDYVAGTGSPPYSQAGMGIDFDVKEFQAKNFAIDSSGKVYASSGRIGAFNLTYWTDQGGNVVPYFTTDFAIWYSSSDQLYHRARLCLSTPNAYNNNVNHEAIWIEEYVAASYDPANPSASIWQELQPPFLVNSAGTITVTTPPDLYQGAKVGTTTSRGLNFFDYFFSQGDTPSPHFQYQSPIGYIGKDAYTHYSTGYPGLKIFSQARLRLYGADGIWIDSTGYCANITNGSSNDTQSFWKNIGSGYTLFSNTGMVNNQPTQYGYLINYAAAAEIFQLWHAQPNGNLYYRGANGSSTAMPNWNRVATWSDIAPTGYSWATLASNSYFSGGSCRYVKIGRVVHFAVADLVVATSSPPHGTQIFTGLPAANTSTTFVLSQWASGGAPTIRMVINTSGQLTTHYSYPAASANQYYGTGWYISAS